MNKKNLIIVLIFILLGSSLNAQVNTSSPYSRYGIGDIENEVLGRGLGMGGISTGLRLPLEINTINPASYSALPNKVFLFQVGVKSKRIDYSTSSDMVTNYDFSLSSINMAFSLKKYWAMSIGISPLSSIGYQISTEDSVFLDDYKQDYDNNYIGEGGLSKLYWGNSFAYKGLSLGINASYVFGSLSKRFESILRDEEYNSFLIYTEDNKTKGLHLRYGIQYNDSILKKYSFTLGAFYENKTDFNIDMFRYLSRTIVRGADITITDTLYNDTVSQGKIEMPMAYGLGFSFLTKKLIIGADYKVSNWEDVLLFNEKSSYLTNSSSFAAGVEYTHNYMSKKYFETVNFRLGAYINNTYITINGSQIKNNGITFGIGLPTKIGTKINIGFDIGQRGTVETGLIKENYYLINLNFNFSDTWFIRRKFF